MKRATVAAMPDRDLDPHERSSTDQSLRVERDATDEELASRTERIRGVATDIVTRARTTADSVLTQAREREDLRPNSTSQRANVLEARAREDALLGRQRSAADEVARDERDLRQVALARLLAFEREQTNLKLEIERLRADKALSSREDFMAMVSHDLRSLLGGIALSAELLREVGNAESLESVKKYAGTIQRFAARMNRLVGDLMDLASIDAGKLSVVLARRNVNQLLLDAVEAFQPAATVHGVELHCESPADLGTLDFDHERILQVLGNLVGNSLKFTPKGGHITVRAQRRGRGVCFAVADTGEGISKDLLAKIFERYFQSSQNDGRGLGLGLFIAHSIVTQHGGTIWAESEPGYGSTFHFTIPGQGS